MAQLGKSSPYGPLEDTPESCSNYYGSYTKCFFFKLAQAARESEHQNPSHVQDLLVRSEKVVLRPHDQSLLLSDPKIMRGKSRAKSAELGLGSAADVDTALTLTFASATLAFVMQISTATRLESAELCIQLLTLSGLLV